MSRIITNTNIIADDFDFCKSYPKDTFIHFLTHFHSDHYQGLSPLWDYGPIYCTHMTKKFLLYKFPKLTRVYACDYNSKQQLEIGHGKLIVNFYLFDANHIPGSSMILFQGYMGTILFTGDFRYDYKMIKENQILFPPEFRQYQDKKNLVQKMSGISIHVDEMIFDNTYCNEVFQFEKDDVIAEKMIQIIRKNLDKKLIYIAMGALGKHAILFKIYQSLHITIVVSEKQYEKISVAGLRRDFLSTNPNDGIIHLVSKKNRAKIVQETKKSAIGTNFICIDTDFLMLNYQSPDRINYVVPYSLHSNYKEMSTFIQAIRPSILRKLVLPYSNFKQVKLRIKIDHRLKLAKYLDMLQKKLQKSQSGYSNLVRLHTDICSLSEQFLAWFSVERSGKLNILLNVGQQDHSLRKRPVILLQQQQLVFGSKKQSLSQIANRMNATNRNLSLEESISVSQRESNTNKLTQLYEKLFQQ